jgi:hypothetical protein
VSGPTLRDRPESPPVSVAPPLTRPKRRFVLLAVIVLVAVVGAAAYVAIATGRDATSVEDAASVDATLDVSADDQFVFRNAVPGPDYGRIGVVTAGQPAAGPALAALRCDRVDVAAGRGVCLRLDQSSFQVSSTVEVFDRRINVQKTLSVPGYPSRTRVAPDGRYAATTTFVSGHSYAEVGFSTLTNIIDLESGEVLFDLEALSVKRDGRPFQAVDFNFWGVTFANDGDRFYATLGTGGETYLIEGDIVTREAKVLRAGVECPMLSPDNTRLVFKSRVPGDRVTWRLSVLDLATLETHPLAETGDVDDQAQWLDDDTVMYGIARPVDLGTAYIPPGLPLIAQGTQVTADTWMVPADGTGAPERLVGGSWSARASTGQ